MPRDRVRDADLGDKMLLHSELSSLSLEVMSSKSLSTHGSQLSSYPSPSMDSSQAPSKYACTLCARRKIGCDKLQPCHNCSKSQVECIYQNPALVQRQRKRGRDSEEPLVRISQYEELLREHNIDFTAYSNKTSWISWDTTVGKPPLDNNILVNTDPSVRIEQAKISGDR
jgi:hypothetical protein